MAKRRKCENEICSCYCRNGDQYCSEECAEFEDEHDCEDEEGCECGHDECTVKVRTGLKSVNVRVPQRSTRR